MLFLIDIGCLFGWMIMDNFCYYFSNFIDFIQILIWNDVKQWCVNKQFLVGVVKFVILDNFNDGVSRFVDFLDDFEKF